MSKDVYLLGCCTVPDNVAVCVSQEPTNCSQSAGRRLVGGCECMPVVLHRSMIHLQTEPETGHTASGAVMLSKNAMHSTAIMNPAGKTFLFIIY